MTTSDLIEAIEGTPFKGGSVSDTMLEWLANLKRWRDEGTYWSYDHGPGSAKTLDALYQRGLVNKHMAFTSVRIGDTRVVTDGGFVKWSISEHGIDVLTKAEEG
jgi:hypothetical protein